MIRAFLFGLLFVLAAGHSGAAYAAPATTAEVAAHRKQLEAQLQAIEADIAASRGVLSEKQKERQSLERDIGILDAQIKQAKLSIKARDLTILNIADDISDKNRDIAALNAKLKKEKLSLAEIIRRSNYIDDQTFVEFAFDAQSVSEFFSDLDVFASVSRALHDSFVEIAASKNQVAAAVDILEEKKDDEITLRQTQVYEKNQIEARERDRAEILKITKGEERLYQDIIKAKERSAAEIRAELFDLRDTTAISFGKALEYAQVASKLTGVRAAVILGVLRQETDLGRNLGSGSYATDMHPTRDVPVYLAITAALGYDPEKMPVSKQPGYGWGGAMGPGQFIPSTWACFGGFVNTTTGRCGKGTDGTYKGPWQYDESKDAVRKVLGKATPSDPWNNQDAFMATAMLMRDNGADKGTRAAERLAALRYFAGFGNAGKSAYAFYGDGVMKHADYFQSQIDLLNKQ